jgi:hypothetical protein
MPGLQDAVPGDPQRAWQRRPNPVFLPPLHLAPESTVRGARAHQGKIGFPLGLPLHFQRKGKSTRLKALGCCAWRRISNIVLPVLDNGMAWRNRPEDPRWHSPRLSAALHSRAATCRNPMGARRRADRQAHPDNQGTRTKKSPPNASPSMSSASKSRPEPISLVAEADLSERITRKPYRARISALTRARCSVFVEHASSRVRCTLRSSTGSGSLRLRCSCSIESQLILQR